MIARSATNRLLANLFAGRDLTGFAEACCNDGLEIAELIGSRVLDTQDAATVLRIISGEGFDGDTPRPGPIGGGAGGGGIGGISTVGGGGVGYGTNANSGLQSA